MGYQETSGTHVRRHLLQGVKMSIEARKESCWMKCWLLALRSHPAILYLDRTYRRNTAFRKTKGLTLVCGLCRQIREPLYYVLQQQLYFCSSAARPKSL